MRELHVKFYAISISGRKTTGVGDKLFTKIRDNWDKEVAGKIDFGNLCVFDWNEKEFLVQKAKETLTNF